MKERIKKIFNRKGMYILEAAITLPVFIIAVVLLISIIPAIRDFEQAVYVTADTVRMESIKAAFAEDSVTGPIYAMNRANRGQGRRCRFSVTGYRYLFSESGIDDLIEIKYSSRFSERNPLGKLSTIVFKGDTVGRAFTGRFNRSNPTSIEEFLNSRKSCKVYVFPEGGKKYHGKGCRYLNPACRQEVLTSRIRKKYGGCSLCKSKDMEDGQSVYVFHSSGKSYHRRKCKSVTRFYIEIEKEDAEKKGYTPCSVCGGK